MTTHPGIPTNEVEAVAEEIDRVWNEDMTHDLPPICFSDAEKQLLARRVIRALDAARVADRKPTPEAVREAVTKVRNASFNRGEWTDDGQEDKPYDHYLGAANTAQTELLSLITTLTQQADKVGALVVPEELRELSEKAPPGQFSSYKDAVAGRLTDGTEYVWITDGARKRVGRWERKTAELFVRSVNFVRSLIAKEQSDAGRPFGKIKAGLEDALAHANGEPGRAVEHGVEIAQQRQEIRPGR